MEAFRSDSGVVTYNVLAESGAHPNTRPDRPCPNPGTGPSEQSMAVIIIVRMITMMMMMMMIIMMMRMMIK